MAHIIALQGPENCGKSKTLKGLLVGMIQQKYPQASTKKIRGGWFDTAVVISGVNGKTIGIDS